MDMQEGFGKEDIRLYPDEPQAHHTRQLPLTNSFGRQRTCPPFLLDHPPGRCSPVVATSPIMSRPPFGKMTGIGKLAPILTLPPAPIIHIDEFPLLRSLSLAALQESQLWLAKNNDNDLNRLT